MRPKCCACTWSKFWRQFHVCACSPCLTELMTKVAHSDSASAALSGQLQQLQSQLLELQRQLDISLERSQQLEQDKAKLVRQRRLCMCACRSIPSPPTIVLAPVASACQLPYLTVTIHVHVCRIHMSLLHFFIQFFVYVKFFVVSPWFVPIKILHL